MDYLEYLEKLAKNDLRLLEKGITSFANSKELAEGLLKLIPCVVWAIHTRDAETADELRDCYLMEDEAIKNLMKQIDKQPDKD